MCYLDCHCSLSTRKSRSHSGCRTSIFVNSHLLVVKHGQQPCSRRCRHPLALSGARGRRGLVPGHPSPPNTPETMVDIGSPHKTMEWGCFRWDQGTGYLWLPTSQHEADAAESSGYMLFVNENFSRVRAELSQAAEEEEESVASVAAAQTTQPSFSSIAKESRGNSGSWNQTFGENMVGKLCMTCCSECWICWPLEIPVGTQIDFILRSLVCRTC